MKMTISVADCAGNAKNVLYPQQVEVTNADQLRAAVAHDHVCGVFKDNRRSVKNFQGANVLVMDCDNDHSDVPAEWVTPSKIDNLFSGLSYALVPSCHDGKLKDGKTARPRFHIYFPIADIEDAQRYSNLKVGIHDRYRFFDGNAVDAARFVYGSEVDADKVVWHEGTCTIDQRIYVSDKLDYIPEGQRNSKMSHFAGKLVKRYGVSDKAHEVFLEQAEKCDPPLGDEELAAIWRSAEKFYNEKIVKQPGYVPPDQYEFGDLSLQPKAFNDLDQAMVLANEYGSELSYTTSTGLLHYDGMVWRESKPDVVCVLHALLDLQQKDAGEAVRAARQDLCNRGYPKADVDKCGTKLRNSIRCEEDYQALQRLENALAYQKFINKRRDAHYVDSTLDSLEPEIAVDVNDFDRDGFLLNTPGGTYDLRHGIAGRHDHTPQDMLTKMTAVAPGEQGADLWRDAVATFFCGDIELMEYVQQIVGLCTIGKVYVEALIIAYGDGRNGKSTFWNTIARVMGSYSGGISADALTTRCRRNVKPEMAEVKGKRLLIAAELEEGNRLDTSIIKQLCSTDEINAEKKFYAPFQFTPTHTLVLYTNHLPKVGECDAGTWRRLIVIPFEAKIEGSSDIKNYSDYLFQNAGPAVLAWAIEGAQKVIAKGYKLDWPSSVRESVDAYREENDWMTHFLEDCCEVSPEYRQNSGDLYVSYRAYTQRSGEFTRSKMDFYAALTSRGFKRKRMKKGVVVYGLKLMAGQDFLG